MGRLFGFWNEGAASHLRKVLEQRGMRVEDLAYRIAVTPRAIRNWLRVDRQPASPSVAKFWQLCSELNLTPDEFRTAAEAFVAYSYERSAHMNPSPLNASLRSRSHLLNVFLCHASQDKPAVRRLFNELQGLPIDIWFDEYKLLPGQHWEHEIRKALRAANVVIVCLSAQAIAKTGFVQKEIRIALDIADEQPDGTIFIIPVRLEECVVPERITRWQWVDLFCAHGTPKLVTALRQRAQDLRKICWPER